MSDVVESVIAWLLEKESVTDLIGDRISPDEIGQNPIYPTVTITKIDTRHDHDLSDLSGLAHARLQFDCYSQGLGSDRAKANEVAEAIRATGIVGIKGMTHGTDIRAVQLESGQRNYTEPPRDAQDQHRYATNFDLMVSYTESI